MSTEMPKFLHVQKQLRKFAIGIEWIGMEWQLARHGMK